MSTRDVTLALLAVAVWGANFTVIRLGLDDVPPLLLAALRYLVAAFPAVLVVPPPALPPGVWVTFGLTNGFGQFACLFTAIHLGLPAGLASVVLQVQALFTTLLAGLLLREPVGRRQAAGLALAASGLGLVATQPGAGSGPIPPLAWALAGGAALCWAVSNILIRRATGPAAAAGEAMVRLVVWSSLVPPLPLLALAVALGGPEILVETLHAFDLRLAAVVLYLAYGATLFASGAWNRLLARYPASQVAPLSLLVPVAGLVTAALVLGERLTPAQALGCSLTLTGLALSTVGRVVPAQAPRRQGSGIARPVHINEGDLAHHQLLHQRDLADHRHPGRVEGDDHLDVDRHLQEDPVEGLVDPRGLEGGPGRPLH